MKIIVSNWIWKVIEYERKLELLIITFVKEGNKPANKFNLKEFKDVDKGIIKLLNQPNKEKIIAKFLQVYEGPDTIKKTKDKSMYHNQDLNTLKDTKFLEFKINN